MTNQTWVWGQLHRLKLNFYHMTYIKTIQKAVKHKHLRAAMTKLYK